MNLGASVASDRQGIQSIKQWTGERGETTGVVCVTRPFTIRVVSAIRHVVIFTCTIFFFYQYDTTCQRFSSVRYAVSVVFTCTIPFTYFFFFFFFKLVRYDVSTVFTFPIRRFSGFHLYYTFHCFLPVRYPVSAVFTSTIPSTVLFFVFTSTIQYFIGFHQYDTFHRFLPVRYDISLVFTSTTPFTVFY